MTYELIDTHLTMYCRTLSEQGYFCKEELVRSKSRKQKVVLVKKMMCYLLYHRSKFTYKAIAKCLGFDHSTILYHCSDVASWETSPMKELREYYSVVSGQNIIKFEAACVYVVIKPMIGLEGDFIMLEGSLEYLHRTDKIRETDLGNKFIVLPNLK